MNRSISTSMTLVELNLRFTRIDKHSRLNSSSMFSIRKAPHRQFCNEQNYMTRLSHDILTAISRMIRHSARADFSSAVSSALSAPHGSINVQPACHSPASPRLVVKPQSGDIRIDHTVVPARSYPPQGDLHLLGPLADAVAWVDAGQVHDRPGARTPPSCQAPYRCRHDDVRGLEVSPCSLRKN